MRGKRRLITCREVPDVPEVTKSNHGGAKTSISSLYSIVRKANEEGGPKGEREVL